MELAGTVCVVGWLVEGLVGLALLRIPNPSDPSERKSP
jgi:hypothetical protein